LIRAFTAPATTGISKPAGSLNRAAFGGLGLKGLPLKPDLLKGNTVLKGNTAASSMDDSVETKRQLKMLGDMPAVDMTMADGEAAIGDLEVDDDDDEDANRIDAESKAKAKANAQNSMDVDEDDDADPLDAFMAGVKDEVKKVNAEDLKKMVGPGRLPERGDDRMNEAGADDDGEVDAEDELDTTDLNPEDILALAAKKARKKDLAVVDHNKIKYEPFRKEFYVPPPEVSAMTDEEADLLRLELDGIKIRGVDCPRPVTKWSHFGLHASVYVILSPFTSDPSILTTSFQAGCHQATELYNSNINSSPSDSCHHVWPRRHWCSQDRLWKDHCVSSSCFSSYQGSTSPRADGRTDGYYHDSDS
jgi:ATP-dependent RNA helicase DDX46/PRP5